MKSKIKIISGKLKGRYLNGPLLDYNTTVRPTSNRAREALFSILQHYCYKHNHGPFLDLFSGTGAIALEAWSRSYHPVTCVELQLHIAEHIKHNIRGTDIKLIVKDVCKLSDNIFINQSVIFADPPYNNSIGLWSKLNSKLTCWLHTDGLIIWETDPFTILNTPQNLRIIDKRQYGNNVFHVFHKI